MNKKINKKGIALGYVVAIILTLIVIVFLLLFTSNIGRKILGLSPWP